MDPPLDGYFETCGMCDYYGGTQGAYHVEDENGKPQFVLCDKMLPTYAKVYDPFTPRYVTDQEDQKNRSDQYICHVCCTKMEIHMQMQYDCWKEIERELETEHEDDSKQQVGDSKRTTVKINIDEKLDKRDYTTNQDNETATNVNGNIDSAQDSSDDNLHLPNAQEHIV